MDMESLRRRFAELSDEALDDVVRVHPKYYTPEALEMARAELRERRQQSADVTDGPPAVSNIVTPEQLRIKGSRWFGIVAVLSLINTAIVAIGSPVVFVLGLATPLIVESSFPGETTGFRLVPHTLMIVIAAMFFLIGYLARHSNAAYVVGMAAYMVDGILALLISAWGILVVHAIVLVVLYMRVSRALEQTDAQATEFAQR